MMSVSVANLRFKVALTLKKIAIVLSPLNGGIEVLYLEVVCGGRENGFMLYWRGLLILSSVSSEQAPLP